ncbi:MAG: chromosomal replication initiator protein DnaA [Peptococcaceae bacterium]|jgi:chromosomal replication initiator protein|nr:chromosomal replication initiator protein DnaA [Peptococcaceae bacterium]
MNDQYLQKTWFSILSQLKDQIPDITFSNWFSMTTPAALSDSKLTVSVPNEMSKNLLENKYYDILHRESMLQFRQNLDLLFVIQDMEDTGDTPAYFLEDSVNINLNPKYTFDTFIVGSSNEFAHAASLAAAESKAKSYNPLFIYGGVGLGKTHLMHAIGHHAILQDSHCKVKYVSSETFTDEFIQAIRTEQLPAFKDKYRSVDILLVDDIQFFAGKESTLEEFHHTFNILHDANKQIVLSCDRHPKDIHPLPNRLLTRFSWGLLTDIQPPDLETRIAILRKKSEDESIKISDDVLVYIASRIRSNIRELEGALNRVIAYAILDQTSAINLDLCAKALQNIYTNDSPNVITMELIQQRVAHHFNLQTADLKNKQRSRNISIPRQIAMYLCREFTDQSYPSIGSFFGGKDHTTVMHAYREIAKNIQIDPELSFTVQRIIDDISNK